MKNILIFIGLLFLTACEDLLETEPRDQADLETALNTLTGLRGVLNDTYHDMQNGGRWGANFISVPEIMSDNMLYLNLTGRHVEYYENQITLADWYYPMVNQTNIVIQKTQELGEPSGDNEARQRDQILGEAHGLRALLYFQLMNLYAYAPTAVVPEYNRGGVPLITHAVTALGDIDPLPRAPIETVYDQIVADLEIAVSLLPQDGEDGLLDRDAARALLSRVALYRGDWDLTIEAASEVINSPDAYLSSRESYAADWALSIHPEALFTLVFESDERVNVNVALANIFTTLQTGNGSYVPSDSYLGLLDSMDIRRSVMQMGRNGRLETIKYQGDEGIGADNIPIIRLSEVYLNRAEAYAQKGLVPEAIADLDRLRQRALGEAFTPTIASGAELLAAIYSERRRELAFEGHRWYDLKRWGRDIDKSDTTGEIIDFETDFRILAPIPQQEIDLNPLIEQNVGYN